MSYQTTKPGFVFPVYFPEFLLSVYPDVDQINFECLMCCCVYLP